MIVSVNACFAAGRFNKARNSLVDPVLVRNYVVRCAETVFQISLYEPGNKIETALLFDIMSNNNG